jgi:L-threonylcarbamoyladenylate synthase
MTEIIRYSFTALPRISDRINQVIRQGGIAAVPTETFYGLGVTPFDANMVERLLALKGREKGKPILVLIGALEQLSLLTEVMSPIARILTEAFWPGPLTILFPALPTLPANLTAGTGRVGVRLSSCESLTALLSRVGPLTGTSANLAGRPPAQTAQMVQQELGEDVDLIVDAGPTAGGMPSTVVDVQQSVRVVREGVVTRQMLQNVLQTHRISLA